MLTPDVRFEGFSPTDWSRLLSSFRVAPDPEDPERPRGGLVLVHDGGRVRKALHTRDGRLDPHTIAWPRDLADVGAEQNVRFIWAMHSGALEELMERFGARVRRGDDVLTQALLLFGAFRELIDEGAITSWPRKLKGVPIPTRAVVDRAIDAVVQPGRTMLLALYEEGELWTALVVRRAVAHPARFDVIAGPMALRREMGFTSGDFRRDYRHLVSAVEAFYGPVSIGLHAEVATFRALITAAEAGDWARAVALRDVVLAPMPLVLGVPLGVDAGRGAAMLAARAARQIDPLGIVQPMLRLMGRALPELPPIGGASPGFNPLELLRRLLGR
ncbi:MAG: hypothetical protein HYV09_30790 [Deltaproteobacteria bacterium]|nr:hypothetical protein [Deltaproteobacteria bacterium]